MLLLYFSAFSTELLLFSYILLSSAFRYDLISIFPLYFSHKVPYCIKFSWFSHVFPLILNLFLWFSPIHSSFHFLIAIPNCCQFSFSFAIYFLNIHATNTKKIRLSYLHLREYDGNLLQSIICKFPLTTINYSNESC